MTKSRRSGLGNPNAFLRFTNVAMSQISSFRHSKHLRFVTHVICRYLTKWYDIVLGPLNRMDDRTLHIWVVGIAKRWDDTINITQSGWKRIRRWYHLACLLFSTNSMAQVYIGGTVPAVVPRLHTFFRLLLLATKFWIEIAFSFIATAMASIRVLTALVSEML
jgi:hypothetical protein